MQSSGCGRTWQAIGEKLVRPIEFLPERLAHLFQLHQIGTGRCGFQARGELCQHLRIDVGAGAFQLVGRTCQGTAIRGLQCLANLDQLLVAAGGKGGWQITREFGIAVREAIETLQVDRFAHSNLREAPLGSLCHS
jgi:hypothetical protein